MRINYLYALPIHATNLLPFHLGSLGGRLILTLTVDPPRGQQAQVFG